MLGAANIWWVPLSNWTGRRPVLIIATLLMMLASVWAAKAESFGSLIAARIFQGVGGGAADTVAPALIGDLYFIHERGRAMVLTPSPHPQHPNILTTVPGRLHHLPLRRLPLRRPDGRLHRLPLRLDERLLGQHGALGLRLPRRRPLRPRDDLRPRRKLRQRQPRLRQQDPLHQRGRSHIRAPRGRVIHLRPLPPHQPRQPPTRPRQPAALLRPALAHPPAPGHVGGHVALRRAGWWRRDHLAHRSAAGCHAAVSVGCQRRVDQRRRRDWVRHRLCLHVRVGGQAVEEQGEAAEERDGGGGGSVADHVLPVGGGHGRVSGVWVLREESGQGSVGWAGGWGCHVDLWVDAGALGWVQLRE